MGFEINSVGTVKEQGVLLASVPPVAIAPRFLDPQGHRMDGAYYFSFLLRGP